MGAYRLMSFGDVAAKLKKHPGVKQKGVAKQEKQEKKPIDLNELYTLRARMLGVLMRDARMARGYSIEEVAAQLQVSPEEVTEWEFGHLVPGLPQMELLAYFLQVPISHFWATETFQHQRASIEIDQDEYVALRNRIIGGLIRSAREERGISPEALAAEVGMSVEWLSIYESGQEPVAMTVLVSLASALNVGLDYFLDDSGRPGQFFELQEAARVLEEMPPEILEFISTPSNHAYIKVAMALSEVPTDTLRKLAENLLDITL